MKFFKSLFLSGLLLTTTPTFAGREDFGIPEDLHIAILEGLDELYNFNFDKAYAIFESIRGQADEHPMISFGAASAYWWRISALVLEPDQEESKPFLMIVEQCIEQADKLIEAGDPTGEGHLVMGGALGLLGRWEATNREWISAYFKGKKAYKYLTKALEINPKLQDANMGLGIFDYYAATLPAVVRVISALGKGGNPQVGLDELTRAVNEGTYSRTPSKLFLSQIYAQEQANKMDKAIAYIHELRKSYPKSPFMHMLHVISLYNSDQLDHLKVEADDLMVKFQKGDYPSDYIAQAHFALGSVPFKMKNWDEASAHFLQGMEAGYQKDPWRTWCRLYLGYCYDAMGKREEAIQCYQQVLKLQRRWGSHDNAKTRIKKRFKGSAEKELKKLEF